MRSVVAQCQDAEVAVFVKQLGRRPTFQGYPAKLKDAHGGDWSEWPDDLRIRQFPDGHNWEDDPRLNPPATAQSKLSAIPVVVAP